MAAQRLHATLSGLGIPSDIGVFFDSVSIGTSSFSTQETLQRIGAAYTPLDFSSEGLALISTPSIGASHTGTHQKSLVFEGFATAPWNVGHGCMRARLALVGGDGAVVRGGPDAVHKGSGASDQIWDELFPGVVCHCV